MGKKEDIEIITYTDSGHTVHYHKDYEINPMETMIQFYDKNSNGKFVKKGKVIPHSFYAFLWENIFGLSKDGSDEWWKVVDICQNQDGEEFTSAWIMWRLKGK